MKPEPVKIVNLKLSGYSHHSPMGKCLNEQAGNVNLECSTPFEMLSFRVPPSKKWPTPTNKIFIDQDPNIGEHPLDMATSQVSLSTSKQEIVIHLCIIDLT